MMSHKIADARTWFARLATDNTREFWAREKEAYRTDVREPFDALLAAADPEHHAEWKVYRPHTDTRFAPQSAPLKTFIGAVHIEPTGVGRYLQLSNDGVIAASGSPYFAPDQLALWREAVADERGLTLIAALESAREAGLEPGPGRAPTLKTVPRGIHPAHPRAWLLRWKGIEVVRQIEEPDTDIVTEVRSAWNAGAALREWIVLHVGPSAMERPRR